MRLPHSEDITWHKALAEVYFSIVFLWNLVGIKRKKKDKTRGGAFWKMKHRKIPLDNMPSTYTRNFLLVLNLFDRFSTLICILCLSHHLPFVWSVQLFLPFVDDEFKFCVSIGFLFFTFCGFDWHLPGSCFDPAHYHPKDHQWSLKCLSPPFPKAPRRHINCYNKTRATTSRGQSVPLSDICSWA